MADPLNDVLPFGAFERLHFARRVLLDDELQADLGAYGLPRPRLPTCLAFLGDCDGPAHGFLAELAQRADDGLRRIFAHCEGLAPGGDVLAWMLAHDRPLAASYVNQVGRSVQQIQQESIFTGGRFLDQLDQLGNLLGIQGQRGNAQCGAFSHMVAVGFQHTYSGSLFQWWGAPCLLHPRR